MGTQCTTLKNGLTIVTRKNNNKTAKVRISVRGGSSIENAGNNGISRFIEFLLFYGTQELYRHHISEKLENLATYYKSTTDLLHTQFHVDTFSANICDVIKLYGRILTTPSFLRKNITTEKARRMKYVAKESAPFYTFLNKENDLFAPIGDVNNIGFFTEYTIMLKTALCKSTSLIKQTTYQPSI